MPDDVGPEAHTAAGFIETQLRGMMGRGTVRFVDAVHASGWNVWPTENGEWAWSAWVAVNGGLPRSGIEATEAEAHEAAQRALEAMLSDAQAAEQARRELPVRDESRREWDPQA
jgi:hypothetical protein